MNYNEKVTQYIESAPTIHQSNLETLRQLIHESVGDVSEEIKWGFPVFTAAKDFTYLRASKNHVTLGFYNFERIKDTQNILQGSGNNMKHIKVGATDEIDKGLLAKWLVAVAG